jgi:hypothetical protein
VRFQQPHYELWQSQKCREMKVAIVDFHLSVDCSETEQGFG